jgi:hypothetical protein
MLQKKQKQRNIKRMEGRQDIPRDNTIDILLTGKENIL